MMFHPTPILYYSPRTFFSQGIIVYFFCLLELIRRGTSKSGLVIVCLDNHLGSHS